MSYDKPNRQKYAFQYDAGNNGNEAWYVKGPKGKAGRLIDYGVEGITEAFTADAQISVGTASDVDAYGNEIAVAAQAIDTVLSLRTLYNPIADAAAFNALLLEPVLPKDTYVVLNLVDDSTTGIGTFFMIIDWAD